MMTRPSLQIRTLWLVMKWQLLTLRLFLPMLGMVQVLLSVGIVVGLGFVIPDINEQSAKHLAAGAGTLSMAGLGMVFIPQVVSQSKAQGTYDFLWSLPVPRWHFILADLLLWLMVAVPALAAGLIVASLHYGFDLDIDLLVIPAIVLVVATGVAIGTAVAHLSPGPIVAGVISQVLLFGMLMFSPLNFPVERLPEVLQRVHTVLPVKYMADIVRATTVEGVDPGTGLAFGVLGAWAIASLGTVIWALNRR